MKLIEYGLLATGAVSGAAMDKFLYFTTFSVPELQYEVIPGVRVFGLINTAIPLIALLTKKSVIKGDKYKEIESFLAGWFAAGLSLQAFWALTAQLQTTGAFAKQQPCPSCALKSLPFQVDMSY